MIRLIIRLYMFIIIADVVLSYIPRYNSHPYRLRIKKLADYICEPIRRILPPSLPMDLSPMLAIFLLSLFIELFGMLW